MTTGTETADVMSESLSPSEMAYFSSKGADNLPPESDTPSREALISDAVSGIKAQEPAQAETQEDDGEGVYIDENGKARSVVTGKFVPHGAFHRERERRKSAETELQQMREQRARADERLAVLNEIIGASEVPQGRPQQQQAVEPPDPETDIFGYVKWQKDEIERLKNEQRSFVQQQEQYRIAQDTQHYYKNDALNYMKSTPDFPDAYAYIAQSYTQELRAKGFSDEQIQANLQAEEAQIAYNAMQQRKSAAQVIYDMAKARGYTPKAGGAASNQQSGQSDPTQKIEAIQRAQKATPTLSGAGGGAVEGLTPETLASMSEEEFAAVAEKLGKHKMRKLLGG